MLLQFDYLGISVKWNQDCATLGINALTIVEVEEVTAYVFVIDFPSFVSFLMRDNLPGEGGKKISMNIDCHHY